MLSVGVPLRFGDLFELRVCGCSGLREFVGIPRGSRVSCFRTSPYMYFLNVFGRNNCYNILLITYDAYEHFDVLNQMVTGVLLKLKYFQPY
jgi:hypothetical protein